jgi:hypothetical protein
MSASKPLAFIAVLALLLAMHGAVPFVALPTLGQSLWTTGFSQSFANDSLFTIHAANFGAPQPAAISFGLAGAWPAGVFISAGMHPADAYAAMVAVWLGIAFFGAYRLARLVSVPGAPAAGAAALWLGMPIIWGHADYSMLGLGIALLPCYFLCALLVMLREPRFAHAALYVAACIVSAFMDGYTFVMFAAGASLLGAWLYWQLPARRMALLRWALPLHFGAFGLACALYVAYVGTASFEPAPLEAFRAWGLDLAFIAVPSEGMHWIADGLGLSAARSEERFFGDSSVWRTTFALPLIAAASWAWWRTRRTSALAGGLLLALLLSFYMALGPSLKVHATRAPGEPNGTAMRAEQALGPTGSAWLSSRVPGLRDMRGAYRWLALSVFGAWLLLALWLASGRRAALFAAAAIGVLNLPNIADKWRQDVEHRDMFLRIEADLERDLGRLVQPHERVAFLPYGNDVLASYLAARLALVAYNTGGDKNLMRAYPHWPATLRQMRMDSIEDGFPAQALLLLARNEADSLVLPYVDLLRAARRWPGPGGLRKRIEPAMTAMRSSGLVQVTEREHYALVRLDQAARSAGAPALEAAILQALCAPPICLRGGPFTSATRPAALAAGLFRVRLYGAGTSTGKGLLEVTSGQGGSRHASIRLPARSASSESRVLAEGYLTLYQRVDDLQLRLIAAEGDMLRLESYDILPRRSLGLGAL